MLTPVSSDFDIYMREVNAILVASCGLDSEDLPDWKYHDDYEDGYSPRSCARRAIAYAAGC